MSSFRTATRAGVGLLIGIAGPTGSGKTFSALLLARGLAGGDDSKIAFIDTEAGRALHYAPREGEAPGKSTFGFAHADLTAPFTPEAYLDSIDEAERAGFSVIVIDSFSHVWAGDGGLQDIHDDELDKAVERARKRAADNGWKFDEDRERDKGSVGAWRAPKTRHKRMVSRLLQCRAHLVICMRAEDKLRMETVEETSARGKTYEKTKITPADKLPPTERWAPICEKRFPYELITSLVLTPERPGVPLPLKLQEQHRAFVSLEKPLSEETGAKLAAWARGDGATQPAAQSSPRAAYTDGGGVVPPAPPPSTSCVAYNNQDYDPARPSVIVPPLPGELMESSDWRYWIKALADLIDAAPDKRAWLAENAKHLLRLKALHPGWVSKLEAKVSAAPPNAAAGSEGASGADGMGLSGAPSTFEQGVLG